MSVDNILICDKPGLRERQRQNRNESILQAALALIVELGYDSLTMEDLAERAGISRQTLYHHFSSKEDITLRAVLLLVEEGIRAIQSIDQTLRPIERLEHVARWMMEVRFTPARAALVKVRPALMPIKAHPDYRRAFDRRSDAISAIVEAAQAGGEISAAISSGMIVQMLLALTCDSYYEELIAAGSATATEVIETVVEMFLRGIK